MKNGFFVDRLSDFRKHPFQAEESLGHRYLLPSQLLLLLLLLSLSSCTGPQKSSWEGARITGQLVDKENNPIQGGYVYAYSAGRSNTLGPADAMSEPSGKDGSYLLIVPEGIYVLAARKRLSGSISGPLRNGDLAGHVSEPVKAASGGLNGLSITLAEFRQGAEGDPKRIWTTDTRVEGRVVDPDGQPVQGAHVFAYKGVSRSDPPDFLAPVTDEEGVFRISLPGSGVYTIGARTGLRGKPRPEDRIGFWGEDDLLRKIVEGSVTEGVVIVISPYGSGRTR
jgi:hypothetical protein